MACCGNPLKPFLLLNHLETLINTQDNDLGHSKNERDNNGKSAGLLPKSVKIRIW